MVLTGLLNSSSRLKENSPLHKLKRQIKKNPTNISMIDDSLDFVLAHNEAVDKLLPITINEPNYQRNSSFSLFFVSKGVLYEYIHEFDSTTRTVKTLLSNATNNKIAEAIATRINENNSKHDRKFTYTSEAMIATNDRSRALEETLKTEKTGIFFFAAILVLLYLSLFLFRDTYSAVVYSNDLSAFLEEFDAAGTKIETGLDDKKEFYARFEQIYFAKLFNEKEKSEVFNRNARRNVRLTNPQLSQEVVDESLEINVPDINYFYGGFNTMIGMQFAFNVVDETENLVPSKTYESPELSLNTNDIATFSYASDSTSFGGGFSMFVPSNLSVNQATWFYQMLDHTQDFKLHDISYGVIMYNVNTDLLFNFENKYNFHSFSSIEGFKVRNGDKIFFKSGVLYVLMCISHFILAVLIGIKLFFTVRDISSQFKNITTGENPSFGLQLMDLLTYSMLTATWVLLSFNAVFRQKRMNLSFNNFDEFKYWRAYLSHSRLADYFVGFTLILLGFMVVRYLSNYYSNFAIIFKTLSKNSNQLLAYIVIQILCILGMATAGHVLFGYYLEEFRNTSISVFTLVFMFIGYYDKDTFKEDKFGSPLVFYFIVFYMLVFNFIMLNLFLSIIRYSFISVKKEIIDSVELSFYYYQKRGKELRTLIYNLITFKAPETGSKKATLDLLGILGYNISTLRLYLAVKEINKEEAEKITKEGMNQVRKQRYLNRIRADFPSYKNEFSLLTQTLVYCLFLVCFIYTSYSHLNIDAVTQNRQFMSEMTADSDEMEVDFNNYEGASKYLLQYVDKVYFNKFKDSEYGTFGSCEGDSKIQNKLIEDHYYLGGPYMRVTWRLHEYKVFDSEEAPEFQYKIPKFEELTTGNCPAENEIKRSVNNINFVTEAIISQNDMSRSASYEPSGSLLTPGKCGGFVMLGEEINPNCVDAGTSPVIPPLKYIDRLLGYYLPGSIKVETLVLDTDKNIVTHAQVDLVKKPSGVFDKGFTVESVPVKQYKNTEDFIFLGIEIITLILILYYAFDQFIKIASIQVYRCRQIIGENTGGEECNPILGYMNLHKVNLGEVSLFRLITEVLQKTVYTLFLFIFDLLSSLNQHLFDSVFNLIDFVSVSLSLTQVFLYFGIIWQISKIQFETGANSNEGSEEIFTLVASITELNKNYSFILSLNVFFLLVRVLGFIRFFYKVYLFVDILARSRKIILLNLVVISIIFHGFASALSIIYGTYDPDFQGYFQTYNTLIMMLLGNKGGLSLMNSGNPIYLVLIIVFYLIFVPIFLNMFAVIMVDQYYSIKNRIPIYADRDKNLIVNIQTIVLEKIKHFKETFKRYSKAVTSKIPENSMKDYVKKESTVAKLSTSFISLTRFFKQSKFIYSYIQNFNRNIQSIEETMERDISVNPLFDWSEKRPEEQGITIWMKMLMRIHYYDPLFFFKESQTDASIEGLVTRKRKRHGLTNLHSKADENVEMRIRDKFCILTEQIKDQLKGKPIDSNLFAKYVETGSISSLPTSIQFYLEDDLKTRYNLGSTCLFTSHCDHDYCNEMKNEYQRFYNLMTACLYLPDSFTEQDIELMLTSFIYLLKDEEMPYFEKKKNIVLFHKVKQKVLIKEMHKKLQQHCEGLDLDNLVDRHKIFIKSFTMFNIIFCVATGQDKDLIKALYKQSSLKEKINSLLPSEVLLRQINEELFASSENFHKNPELVNRFRKFCFEFKFNFASVLSIEALNFHNLRSLCIPTEKEIEEGVDLTLVKDVWASFDCATRKGMFFGVSDITDDYDRLFKKSNSLLNILNSYHKAVILGIIDFSPGLKVELRKKYLRENDDTGAKFITSIKIKHDKNNSFMELFAILTKALEEQFKWIKELKFSWKLRIAQTLFNIGQQDRADERKFKGIVSSWIFGKIYEKLKEMHQSKFAEKYAQLESVLYLAVLDVSEFLVAF